ncbi:hypothetical protein Q5691_18475 [Microcoleus sp. w1-18aA5]
MEKLRPDRRFGWHFDFERCCEAQIAKTPSLNASKRLVSTLTSSASNDCQICASVWLLLLESASIIQI